MLGSTLLIVCVAFAGSDSSTLMGVVTGNDGGPIESATVSIYSAKPREGLGTLCASCYRDCAKSTKTAVDGTYQIGDLDPSLLFRVLIASPGRRSLLTDHVDPAGDILKSELVDRPTDLANEFCLKGRVIDEDGNPVVGAVIDPYGAKTTSRRWWGQLPGVDPMVVSDEEGRFIVVSEEKKLGMDLKVTGRDFAVVVTPLLGMDGREHEVALNRGASVTGRLVQDGRPAANRVIGIVQASRSSGKFVGETTIATNAEGVFRFDNLQINEEYVAYALCDGVDELTTLKTVRLTTGGDRDTADLGELPLIGGMQFSGRVVMPDDVKVPSGSTIRLSRDPAWDWKQVTINADGAFNASGLPPEVYSIWVNVPAYEIDSDNFRYQMVRDRAFGLNIKKDYTNFKIPLRSK